MPKIAANFAADLASNVYDLSRFGVNKGTFYLKQRYSKALDLNEKNITVGKTGGPAFFKSRTAFGFAVCGAGAYKGHAFIVLRGSKFLADWLTNANVGVSRSRFAQPVHDGFNRAFKSMESQLTPFVNSLADQGISSVHCVGHSLGGALASVTAEYVKATTGYKPYLYTFGAPRVGLHAFADMFTSTIGPERLFRVYHRTDIVPCIPFWPFVHFPTRLSDTNDYFQPSPGEFPGGEWHSMNRYVTTVGRNNWSTLRGRRSQFYSDSAVEDWITKRSPISFTATNLEWLDRAINYVLVKILDVLGSLITTTGTSALTLMDQLAIVLKKGIDISNNMSELVLALIRRIMTMLGLKPALDVADATYMFIRNIFQQLYKRVSDYCRRVLDDVLVSGKGV